MAGFGALVFLATFFGTVLLAWVLGLSENQFLVLGLVTSYLMWSYVFRTAKRWAGVDHG